MPSHDWKLSSYDYRLPQSLIAQHPAPKRDHSRMLFLERKSRKIKRTPSPLELIIPEHLDFEENIESMVKITKDIKKILIIPFRKNFRYIRNR